MFKGWVSLSLFKKKTSSLYRFSIIKLSFSVWKPWGKFGTWEDLGKGWIRISGPEQCTKGKKDTSVPEHYRGQWDDRTKHVFPMWCMATVATKPHNGKSSKPSWPGVSDGQTVHSKTERNNTGKENKERGQGKVAAAWAEPRCLQRGQTTRVISSVRIGDPGLLRLLLSCPSCSLGSS